VSAVVLYEILTVRHLTSVLARWHTALSALLICCTAKLFPFHKLIRYLCELKTPQRCFKCRMEGLSNGMPIASAPSVVVVDWCMTADVTEACCTVVT